MIRLLGQAQTNPDIKTLAWYYIKEMQPAFAMSWLRRASDKESILNAFFMAGDTKNQWAIKINTALDDLIASSNPTVNTRFANGLTKLMSAELPDKIPEDSEQLNVP